MSAIVFFKDITKNDIAFAGGKGASLGEMTRAGIAVPPGFVIGAPAFDLFLEQNNFKEKIAQKLKEINFEDAKDLEKASLEIRTTVEEGIINKNLEAEILSAFSTLGAEFVAVRSSATAEDAKDASWAGELETYLNTTEASLVTHIKKCWSSLFTPRALFYRHEKALLNSPVSVAVVVQKMIQSEVSGIAFTVHPVTEDHNQMIIEAGFGLGEAIVSGSVTPDSYVVNKNDLSIVEVSVNNQSRKLVKVKGERGKAQGVENEWVQLNESEGSKQKLSGIQIVESAKMFKKIEDHYGFPCDIEWAIENGVLYITQSRPITTLKR